MEWYPILFSPIFQKKSWGGIKIKDILMKNTPYPNTGEVIELAGTGDNVSRIINGYLRGTSLDKAIQSFPEEILGSRGAIKFDNTLPLSVKFIDIGKDLSPMVITNDDDSTEGDMPGALWFILDSSDSRIGLGLKDKGLDHKQIKSLIKTGKLEEALDPVEVRKDDSFKIKSGTLYQFRSGILLAQIKPSETLIYDLYNTENDLDMMVGLIKPEYEGNPCSIEAELIEEKENFTRYRLCKNKYFNADKIIVKESIITSSRKDSFDVLVVVEGHSILFHRLGEISLYKGDTLLIPAYCGEYTIEGHSVLLDIHS